MKEFANNIAGDHWVANYMGCHGLTNTIATNIRRKHAQISKEQLREYFNNVEQELKDVPASNISSYGETNLRDDPGARKYVMERGTKYSEKVTPAK